MKKSAIVALSALTLFSLACGSKGGGGGATSPGGVDLTKYVPENSNLIVVIDVAKVAGSSTLAPHLPKIKAEVEKEQDYKDFVAASGIDPWKDVTNVIIAGDTNSDENVVVIVAGKFDANKAAPAIKEKMKDEKAVVEALDASTLLMGTTTSVPLAKAAKGLAGSAALKEIFDAADKSQSIYGAAVITEKMKGDLPPGSAAKMKGIAGSADFGSGVDIKMSARFASADEATAAKTEAETQFNAFKPMIGMVGLPETVLSGVSFSTSGNDAVVNFKLSPDQIKLISDTIEKMSGAGGAPEAPPAP